MGIESNGMVLAASPEGGKPTLVTFDGDVPPGSRIRWCAPTEPRANGV